MSSYMAGVFDVFTLPQMLQNLMLLICFGTPQMPGPYVYAPCRNAEKVANVSKQISAAAAGGKISSYTFDMSSFADVRKFAEAVRADHPSINVLINNAGIFSKQKAFSKDGIEMTWAVNALAPFLLTSLLLDTVTERIVNVGSMALAGSMDFNNLQQVKQC